MINLESQLISGSPIMNQIQEAIRQIAPGEFPVLISGEPGVEKWLAAQLVHRHSHRPHQPFVRINCAVPSDTLRLNLFGCCKRAFRDIVVDRPGKVEIAHRGTLFLDEAEWLTASLQKELSVILESGRFRRLGQRQEIRVDLRIVAALTLLDHESETAFGPACDGFFSSWKVVTIHIPPLRERREDIPLLCNYYLRKFCQEYNTSPRRLSSGVVTLLQRYSWPGNLRELADIMKRYVVFQDLRAIYEHIGCAVFPQESSSGSMGKIEDAEVGGPVAM